MPCYGEKLNEAVQNLRIKLYVMSFDSVQMLKQINTITLCMYTKLLITLKVLDHIQTPR